MNPEASVVIPSFRSKEHVGACLRALSGQSTSFAFEVVLVDSSDDGTGDYIREKYPWVRLFQSKDRLSAGAARNTGMNHALGKFLFFTDTDCTPHADWLETMYTALKGSDALVVGGSLVNGTPFSLTGSAGFYLEFYRFLGGRGKARPASFLVSANYGVRPILLERYRFCDESLGEDMLLTWTVANENPGRVLFVPDARIVHANRTGFRTLLDYQRRLGRAAVQYRLGAAPGQIRTMRKYPFLCLGLPLLLVPWITLSVARRGSLADLANYICSLPFCIVGNLSWLRGFYEALRERSKL